MNKLATTKLSSRGQVVIPDEIREQMHLHTGDRFIIFAEKDVVILKVISRPEMSEFSHLISAARTAAKKAGFTEDNLQEVIKDARVK